METTDWQCGAWGVWVWDATAQDFYRTPPCYKYDLYVSGHVCDSKEEKEWQGYNLCDEMTDWQCGAWGDWVWDAGVQGSYRTRMCCRYDLYIPGHVCGSKEEKEWRGYEPCDEMTGWVLSEMGPWYWHETRQTNCRELTYVKYDLYIPGHVCETKHELVCRDVKPTPTPTLPVPELPICPDCVERVMFQSDRDGNWEIYRADADGSNPARLTNNDANDESPHWQPQGVWVVFQSNRDGNWEVYRMNNDGLDQRNLSENPYADMAPFMSCRWVYFQGDRDGNWEIYRMDFDGSNQTRLTIDPGTDAQPSASCL